MGNSNSRANSRDIIHDSSNFKFEIPLKENHYEQPTCTIWKSSEYGERWMAQNFTRPDACVLEFGAGLGSVTAVVQEKLETPACHVAIEPGTTKGARKNIVQYLGENVTACNMKTTILNRTLEKNDDVTSPVPGKNFDTLIVDCEGCLTSEYKKNPHLFDHITQVQVERDDGEEKPYDEVFKKMNLKQVFRKKTGCGNTCFNEVWEK